MFRWGDTCPGGGSPYEPGAFDDHIKPNAFGLTFPANSYEVELCKETRLRGGDGGEFVCGGGDGFLSWLRLATAFDYTGAFVDNELDLMEVDPLARLVKPLFPAETRPAKRCARTRRRE